MVPSCVTSHFDRHMSLVHELCNCHESNSTTHNLCQIYDMTWVLASGLQAFFIHSIIMCDPIRSKQHMHFPFLKALPYFFCGTSSVYELCAALIFLAKRLIILYYDYIILLYLFFEETCMDSIYSTKDCQEIINQFIYI